METIKNSLPTLASFFPGNVQLNSFTPHYYYFLIMNNFLLSIRRWINAQLRHLYGRRKLMGPALEHRGGVKGHELVFYQAILEGNVQ